MPTLLEPEVLEPELETPVQETRVPTELSQSSNLKQRFRNLMVTIFEGHEEFLGWTPD